MSTNPTTGPMMDQEESYENTAPVDSAKLLQNTGEVRGYCEGKIVEGQHVATAVPITDTRNYSNDPYTDQPSQTVPWDRPNFKPTVTPDAGNLRMTESKDFQETIASQTLGETPVVTDPRKMTKETQRKI